MNIFPLVIPSIAPPLSRPMFGENDVTGGYKTETILRMVFLLQAYSTRHHQRLPPKE